MADTRNETDSLGIVEVPADKLWGAQTQRSLEHFSIGRDLMPREMITAYATLKKAAALANRAGKRLDDQLCELIVQACDEIVSGRQPHQRREHEEAQSCRKQDAPPLLDVHPVIRTRHEERERTEREVQHAGGDVGDDETRSGERVPTSSLVRTPDPSSYRGASASFNAWTAVCSGMGSVLYTRM